MSTLKQIFTNWRIIILIIFLIFAVIAIRPNPFQEGVAIKAVMQSSTRRNREPKARAFANVKRSDNSNEQHANQYSGGLLRICKRS